MVSTSAQQAGAPAALAWPSPPYASYKDNQAPQDPLPCEVEGKNGQIRACLLTHLDLTSDLAYVQVPPSQANMRLNFATFKRLTIKQPLAPNPLSEPPGTAADASERLVGYRPRLGYQLEFKDGSLHEGVTIGHVQGEHGVFLFHPLDEADRVERVFYPSAFVAQFRIGEAIGKVLVEQKSVSDEQVEHAVVEQGRLRQRTLGEYLVQQAIVSPEQLLMALDAQANMPMVRIGEALIALKLITEQQLRQALEQQKLDRRLPLGELLVHSGQLSRQDLKIALARKMGYPTVDIASFTPDLEALKLVPLSLAVRLNVLPLLWRNASLVVTSEDPTDRNLVDELEFAAQCKVIVALANGSLDSDLITRTYRRFGMDSTPVVAESAPSGFSDTSSGELLESLEIVSQQEEEKDNEPLIEQSDNSLVRLINSLVAEAHDQGASDIHIETHPTQRKVRVRFRKDGRLMPYMELPHTYRAAIVARIKVMASLDISERRRPQDGKIDFNRYAPSRRLELRVATIPTRDGVEDVVMRLLESVRPLKLTALGLSPENHRHLRAAVQRPYGLFLCVGPTGSGKTTTLHSVLQHLNTPDRKIWTAEDPIEISNPDLRQVQVNPRIDWTFAKALRAFLRADPDVIMVGEIRDAETAEMAIESSLTGHLVLSTLHTNSAPETIVRLLDMGMDPFSFADSLLGVLAQRLVRQLCQRCVVSQAASREFVDELLEDYLQHYPEGSRPDPASVLAGWTDRHGRDGQLLQYSAPGCPHCQGQGFKGRLGLHELLLVDEDLRHLMHLKAPTSQLKQAAFASGNFRTLRQDGITKVLSGLTSIDVVRANCN